MNVSLFLSGVYSNSFQKNVNRNLEGAVSVSRCNIFVGVSIPDSCKLCHYHVYFLALPLLVPNTQIFSYW